MLWNDNCLELSYLFESVSWLNIDILFCKHVEWMSFEVFVEIICSGVKFFSILCFKSSLLSTTILSLGKSKILDKLFFGKSKMLDNLFSALSKKSNYKCAS